MKVSYVYRRAGELSQMEICLRMSCLKVLNGSLTLRVIFRGFELMRRIGLEELALLLTC